MFVCVKGVSGQETMLRLCGFEDRLFVCLLVVILLDLILILWIRLFELVGHERGE